jgi:serine/threonine-protein kinase
VPQDLRDLIADCLQKDPELRPPNAAAFAFRLGLGDHEVVGLALGLAQAITGQVVDQEPEPTQAMPTPVVAQD